MTAAAAVPAAEVPSPTKGALSATDESDSEATVGGLSGTDTETESIASSRSAERNRRKKERKKAAKKALALQRAAILAPAEEESQSIQVEYVSQQPVEDLLGTAELKEFVQAFSRFSTPEELTGYRKAGEKDEAAKKKDEAKQKAGDADAEDDEGEGGLSRKQKKKMKRLTIAELKQLVSKPEVVEAWDVTASDPRLLVLLKSTRNTIPVPRHWAQKRKFLQGKRGVEKPPFQLPEFIAATGIEKIRASVMEKENAKRLKGKMKERVQPKMGKIDIDYQVLHDAFFKFQTKPRMTRFGDVYYEGKEHEVLLREKRPGQVSEELQKALGMESGGPPPWLVNMQRYGPPPSYPNLKIPGLNAPIPEGATYGYHPGGWGKPPVDEFGRPLYGDVFGTSGGEPEEQLASSLSREDWGKLDDEEEESEDEDQGEEEGDDQSELSPEEMAAGISSIASQSSLPSGMETPDSVHLRKSLAAGQATPDGMDTPDSVAPRQLYQVLPQRDARVGGAAFGSSHTYDLSSANGGGAAASSAATAGGAGGSNLRGLANEGVALALDPSELERLDEATLKARYEEQRRAELAASAPEDVSDIIEEQERKRRRRQEATGRR
eukprot:scaffold18101_cov26-Tisochrysis_lutea.AAC.1